MSTTDTFYRRVVKRETYANGRCSFITLECGHTYSGPGFGQPDFCLACQVEAGQHGKKVSENAPHE